MSPGKGGGGFNSVPPELLAPQQAGPMVPCHSCGRTFNQQAYQKHAKVGCAHRGDWVGAGDWVG